MLLYILCSDYRFLVRVDIIIVCSDLCVFLNAGIPFVFKFVRVSVCWYIFCVQICACFIVLVYI